MSPVAIEYRIWKNVVDQGFRMACVMAFFGANASLAAEINSLAGRYSISSQYCTQYKGGKISACSRSQRDCMLIKPDSKSTLHLEIYSLQADGHSCGVNGRAQIEEGRIIYRDTDAQNREWVFEIVDSGKFWIIKNTSTPGHQSPFCGVHASLDGLKFPKASKRSLTHACFAG